MKNQKNLKTKIMKKSPSNKNQGKSENYKMDSISK
jgi:hypothetical protein